MTLFAFISGVIAQTDTRWLFADEKINTVLVVVAVILLGIVVYLLRMGVKVSQLEKRLEEEARHRNEDDKLHEESK